MSQSNSPVVVALGEVLWDEFPHDRLPGGSSVNLAFHVNQLGGRGILVSRAGADDAGDELVRALNRRGVDTTWVQRDTEHATGRATLTPTPGGGEGEVHEDVAWDHVAFDDTLAGLCRLADAICFGTLAQRCRTTRETIHRCLYVAGERTTVVYDVNLRHNAFQRKWIERSLRRANVVKVTADEVVTLGTLLQLGTTDEVAFAAAIREAFGVGLVCITRGTAGGCLLASRARVVDCPAEPVEAVDPSGTGDAFTAALTVALRRRWSLERAAEFANEVARLVASQPGATPVLANQLESLLESAPTA